MRLLAVIACTGASLIAAPASAQELFGGVYKHGVDTPFTFETGEGGTDFAAGYRFAPIEGLAVIGKPAPFVLASINTRGDTSFVGGGLSWTLGKGRIYLRPGIGIVVHDGPGNRVDPVTRYHTELGSRVLFEPEIGLGYRVTDTLSVEASWMHVSQGRIFNDRQNPGIDMMGLRANWRM